MTCEKFEDALMDELYGELDEVTSAALRRHASSCVRCAERLSSLRATRKVLASAFGPVDPPADLEERIFAAAAEARKVVPIKSRMTRYVSVAGRWAMRPQTAMAAVFLVMIGSSVVFMRERPANMSNVVVTERGAPAESAAGELAAADRRDRDKGGDLSAAAAHGPEPVAQAAATIAPNTASPADLQKSRAESAPAASAVAMNEKKSAGLADDGFAPRPRSAPSRAGSVGGGSAFGSEAEQAVAARPAAKAASAPVAAATPAAPPPAVMAPGGAADSQGSPFASAMAAYRGKRYSDATRMFDSLAQQGDANAALWAARSERESSGCASAVGRFDRIGGSSWGTAAGYDATLEAGKCYRSLGSFEAARARFARLLTVPSHAARAQAELDAMSPRAAKPPAAAAPSKAGTVAE